MISLLVSLLSGPALACGGLFHPPGVLAEANTQAAILEPLGGSVRIDYLVNYQGDAKSFGWVIPVPGTVEDVADGDETEFSKLDADTAPEEDLEEAEEGRGCSSSYALKGGDAANLSDTAQAGGVIVVNEGFTGTYEYTVLEADSSEDLLGWLADNGFEADDAAATIDAYVVEGGYQWVAVELASEDDMRQEDLPPLSIQYAGDALQFPARMARWGELSGVHTILYVKGDQRATLSAGWEEEELDLVWDEGEDPDYMRSEAWPEALAEAGRNGKFAVVFAGELDGQWVTRFENVAEPEAFVADAAFALDGGQEEVRTLISNQGGCAKPEGAWILLIPAGWLLRRARRK